MALILPFGDHHPRVGRDVFVAPNATLIGDVEIADEASIWFGAVLRGDIGSIRIGARTNIQDLACVHLTESVSITTVGSDVTVGHGAILHGCTVGDRCLIGMGSILLDNCVIGEGSVVAAGSLVAPNTVVPPRSLVRGSPAKVIREVTEREGKMGSSGAEHYLVNARHFRLICGDLPSTPPARFADAREELVGDEQREREREGDRGKGGRLMMRLTVNGEGREVADGTTVRGLLDLLELGAGPVAVERNGDVVPRAEHAGTALGDGDVIEVVHFVGGG